MFFNSLTYLGFLIISVTVYWLLPIKGRLWWVLIASLIFYGFWRVEFVLLITFSAYIDYFFSLRIFNSSHPVKRKLLLLTSLSTNIGLLVYFKYMYFIIDNMSAIGTIAGQNWHFNPGDIILPLGISFYTFVSISYTIDVYRRLMDPVRSFGIYLTYVMFWPHMIAGPILRGHELITQLTRKYHFTAENLTDGIKTILIGLFLKVGLADQLAPLVDNAFNTKTDGLSALDVWTMAFSFGFQIYFDFAGYSLIAIGSARLMGIHFPDNFNWPYLATSPREFWKRWHITLSSWVRDYLYLPLSAERFRDRSEGGIDIQVQNTKAGNTRLTISLFTSWFLMGLWHGASWNFAVWGVWHASLIFLYRVIKDRTQWLPEKFREITGWGITLPLIMLGWIPFRADSLSKTFDLYGKILNISSYRSLAFRENYYLFVFLIFTGMLLMRLLPKTKMSLLQNAWIRQAGEVIALSIMIFFVFVFLKPVNQFIYFQF